MHRYGALPMRKLVSTFVICLGFSASLHAAQVPFEPVRASAEKPFVFKDANGKSVSVPVADASAQRKLVGPVAKVDPHLNPALARAATIAQERAHAHSKSRCWRYVKEA